MSATEQEYKNHIKELEQQVRLLKEQVDFLTRKLYRNKIREDIYSRNRGAGVSF